MGEVWRAKDTRSQRLVAAKLLHRQYTQDVAVVARFVQERSLLMDLRHQNIVQVEDLVVEGDNVAIVMELVEGGSIRNRLDREQTLSPAVAVAVMCHVLDAVGYAHSKGVLHRDVKPDNVLVAGPALVGPGDVKLSDFGIARIAQEDAVRATGFLGTPAYLAPEMFESGVSGQASDVYSAGVMLYELLAGRTPFSGGDSPIAVGLRHVRSLPPRLPVGEHLWAVIGAMLAKDPSQRPSAIEAAAALRALPAGELGEIKLPVQPQPARWEDAPDGGRVGDNLQDHAAEGDIGQTMIPTSPPVARRAATVDMPAVVSASMGGDVGATMLGINRGANPTDPISHSQISPPTDERSSKRRRWMVIGGVGLVVLAVAVAVLVWATHRNAQTAPSPVAYTPGHAVGTELPSGLRIDLDAAAATDPNTITVEVTLTAARASGLTGDVLFVLPSQDGNCPTLVSSDPQNSVSPALASSDGVSVPCAFKLAAQVAAGSSQRVALTVSGVTEPDLGAWVSAEQSATQGALARVTGSGFALQRITGVTVNATSVQLTGDTVTVPYAVYPVWTGSTASTASDPLFTNTTLDFQTTDLLKTLTGGNGFSAVSVSACSAAQVVGHSIIADQPARSCSVSVQVGNLNPAQAVFAISMGPS